MTQIIFPKFGGGSTVGHIDAAYALEERLRKILQGVIDKPAAQALDEYFILVLVVPDGPFIRERVLWGIPTSVLRKSLVSRGMLSTVLYFRNNKTMKDNELLRIWVLPRDVPIPEEYLSAVVDNPNGDLSAWNIEDDAKRFNVPILLS